MNVSDYLLRLVEEAQNEITVAGHSLSSVMSKAIRVARLRNDYRNLWWLELEMRPDGMWLSQSETMKEILAHYSKDDFGKDKAYIMDLYITERSLGSLVPGLGLPDDRTSVLGIPQIEARLSETRPFLPPKNVAEEMANIELSKWMAVNRAILFRIENRVRTYLSQTEKELIYGQVNADVFVNNTRYVQERLLQVAPETLDQLQSASRRLSENDRESRSQALLSCRRALKTLADRLYPPRKEPVVGIDGKSRVLSDDKYIARLWQYVADRVGNQSAGKLLLSRIEELGRRLDSIYELTNKGIHAEVSDFEASEGVSQTFLLIGDILRLAENDSAIGREEDTGRNCGLGGA